GAPGLTAHQIDWGRGVELWQHAGAVGVCSTTDLHRARVDVGVVVVAVVATCGAHSGVPHGGHRVVAVVVAVVVAALVGGHATVVDDVVAKFFCARVGLGAHVVAVAATVGAGRRGRVGDGHRHVAIVVVVFVAALVSAFDAVVVDVVADLSGRWVHHGVGVVTVVAQRRIAGAWWCACLEEVVGLPVTVGVTVDIPDR